MDQMIEQRNLSLAPAFVKQKSSVGTIIILVIIVAIIVIGAFYTWGQRVAEERGLPPTELPE